MRSLILVLLVLLLPRASLADTKETQKVQSKKLSNITGDEAFGDNQSAWDHTYARKEFVFGKEAAAFLKKNLEKLPKGQALDIAIGEGRNAIYLAKKGFIVEGVDISAVGLRKAQNFAAANGVKIQTTNADLNKYKIKPDFYNVILNFYYLNRALFPQIKAGLKKGGVVVFEANLQTKPGAVDASALQPGELKAAFSDLEILEYTESRDGKYPVASLLARKK